MVVQARGVFDKLHDGTSGRVDANEGFNKGSILGDTDFGKKKNVRKGIGVVSGAPKLARSLIKLDG